MNWDNILKDCNYGELDIKKWTEDIYSEITYRWHCLEDVIFTFAITCFIFYVCYFLRCADFKLDWMTHKIIQYMETNDRALIVEGSCVNYHGECNVGNLWLPIRSLGLDLSKIGWSPEIEGIKATSRPCMLQSICAVPCTEPEPTMLHMQCWITCIN